MSFKKVIYISALVSSSVAYAAEDVSSVDLSKKSIDIIGSVGFTAINGYSNDLINDNTNTQKGFNINLMGLYSLPNLGIATPVVGGGLHLVAALDKNDLGNGSTLESGMGWFSGEANAGFKFVPVSKFSLFTLANLGYGFSNVVKLENSSNSRNSDIKAKNHYYYGATVIGTYAVSDSLSLGAMFAYNKHSAKFEMGSDNENITFNEYSTSLVLQYSL